MTGVIVSNPPAVDPPPSSASGSTEILGPYTYSYAIPNLTQTWTGVQTFYPNTLVLYGSGGASNVLVQSSLGSPVSVRQLAFADISGVAAATQLPTPTASTLGGVFSKAAASHQFLTQIGTDGSITAAQPSVSDISGGQALTSSNDTNVTIVLGGSPTTSLLASVSITMGWSGTLSAARGGFGADISAQSGVPLFTTGTATFTGTTGSGTLVRATSPTLVTPALGTPSSGNLSNCTSLPLTGVATQAAYTILGNFTGSAASPTASAIGGLTQKATPAGTDLVLIQDQAAGGQLKFSSVSAVGASSGISSIDAATGAFTTGNGIASTGSQIQLTAARRTLPTTQVFTSGSGTYTTPANVLWIEIELIGGGGGGAGSGTSPGAAGDGGNTTFSTLTGNGGSKATTSAGGGGGTASGGHTNKQGATGGNGSGVTNQWGGIGAASFYGGGGIPGQPNQSAGGAAPANSGAGGGGGGVGSTLNSGGGGGAGGFVRAIINSPAATYSYAVGAGGTAGTAGTGGVAGGAGGSGFITVIEHYGS